MKVYRFVLPRSIFCRVFEHMKDVAVCIAAHHEECLGCGDWRDYREKNYGRTHRVVESVLPPGPAYDGVVLVIEQESKKRKAKT